MMQGNNLEKGLQVLSTAKASQWCYVNVDNEFNFMDSIFVIDNSVEEYKVHNRAGAVDDFTNEAYMEEILVVLDGDGSLKFYNQTFDLIDNDKVITKE